jgi:signal recognition particle subunit SRP54
MTKEEREKPSVLNGSRRARVAAGAGVSVTTVNQMMKRYNETRKMMKQVMANQEAAMGSRKGKKGKKKKKMRKSIPGMGGIGMGDLKRLQEMIDQQ